jgi:SAM-dependent methyltransferase
VSGVPAASGFSDHFSAVATQYALARPDYPRALFDWIAAIAPARGRVWEAGCGSGQATAGLAAVFADVHATDPSAQQIAQAPARSDVHYAVEPAEHCSLADASVDAVCVAQALHWFDRPAFFAECARVLRPGGVLVVWGYQDIEVPEALRESVAAFAARIRDAWPAERVLVDRAYADIAMPFAPVDVAEVPTAIETEWPLTRMLAYFSSYSAVNRYREAHGIDPVATHAWAMAEAWGERGPVPLRWPLFVHARRKS